MEDYASDEDLFEEFPVKKRKKKEDRGLREPSGEKLLAEKLRSLLVGVPPPPNLNDAVCDPATFLNLWYKNKDLYLWSKGTSVRNDGDAPEKKFGLYYNVSEWSEEVDGLRRRFGERVVSLETDSWTQRSWESSGATAALTSSAKKRARRNGWLRSPGRRLDYLARRRSVFAPPRLAPRRTILLDAGKPPAPALRRSPRRGAAAAPVRALFTSPDGGPRAFESPRRVGIRRRSGEDGGRRGGGAPPPRDLERRGGGAPPPRDPERRRSSANRSLTFAPTPVAEKKLAERDRKRLLLAVARSLKEGGVSESDGRYREVLGRLFRLSARMWLSREEGDFATGGSRSEAMLEIAAAYLPSLVAPPPPPSTPSSSRPVRVVSSLVEDDGTPKARREVTSPPVVSPKTTSSESSSEDYRSPPVLEKMDDEGKRSEGSDPGEVSPPVLEIQEPLSSGKRRSAPRRRGSLEVATASSAVPQDFQEPPPPSVAPQDLPGNSPVLDEPAPRPDSPPLQDSDPTDVTHDAQDTTATPELPPDLPEEITVPVISTEGTPVPPVSPDGPGSPLETTTSVERTSDPEECEDLPGVVTTTSATSPSVDNPVLEEQIPNCSVLEDAAVPGSPAAAEDNPVVFSDNRDITEDSDPGILEVPEEVSVNGMSKEGTESPPVTTDGPGVLPECENLPEKVATSGESPEVPLETEDKSSGGYVAASGAAPEAVVTPGGASPGPVVSWEEESPLDSPDDAGARKEEALPEAAHMSRAGETPPSRRVCDPDLPEEAREGKSPPETGKRRREGDEGGAAAKRRRTDAAPGFALEPSAPRRDADVATVVFDLVRPISRRFPDYERRPSDYRVLRLDEKTFELEIPGRVLEESVEGYVDVSAVLTKAGSLVEACAGSLLSSDEKENLSDNRRASLSEEDSSDSSASGLVVAAAGRSLRVVLPASAVRRYVDTAKIASVVTGILDAVAPDFAPRIGID